MRQYQPLWERLKKDLEVSITANRRVHQRIFKAVKKEKWMDKGFKLQIEPKIALLSRTSIGPILTFKLSFVYYDGRSGPITEDML